MRILCIAMVGVALLTVASGAVSGGQIYQKSQTQPIPGQTPGMPPLTGGKPGEPDPATARMEDQAARARGTERQKRLVADTEKLLALATDLKSQVDKTNQNVLSIDVIKKAEEIEKLAHSVKERMKGT